MTSSDAFQAAVRLLKCRERSERELRQRLARKGFAPSDIDGAMHRCRELGYVDDRRFARSRGRQLLASGRAVGGRLRHELQMAGIAEELVEESLSELGEEFDEEALLTELLQRRHASFDYRQADEREKRRVINYFQRRGFALATILKHLKKPS